MMTTNNKTSLSSPWQNVDLDPELVKRVFDEFKKPIVRIDHDEIEEKRPPGLKVQAVPQTRSMVRKSANRIRRQQKPKPNKSKKSSKKMVTKRRSPLKDVSAETISLQDAADFVGAVWKYGSYALGAINAELKENFFLVSDGTLTSQNGQTSAIIQGSGYNQRNGNSIKVENVRMELLILVNPTATANYSRLIVFRDFMNLGALPAVADLLEDTGSATRQICSPYKHSLGDRFEVLYDETYNQVVSTDRAVIHRRVGFGINDHVLYQGSTSNIGDTWQGAVFYCFITDQGVNGPKVTLTFNTFYVDD